MIFHVSSRAHQRRLRAFCRSTFFTMLLIVFLLCVPFAPCPFPSLPLLLETSRQTCWRGGWGECSGAAHSMKMEQCAAAIVRSSLSSFALSHSPDSADVNASASAVEDMPCRGCPLLVFRTAMCTYLHAHLHKKVAPSRRLARHFSRSLGLGFPPFLFCYQPVAGLFSVSCQLVGPTFCFASCFARVVPIRS